MLTTIDPIYLEKSFNWEDYLSMTEHILASERPTGAYASAGMMDYTRLNLSRMNRWMKTYQPSAEVIEAAKQAGPMLWLVITEPWCGDAAHNLPALVKMAEHNPSISIRFILRDENPQLMDHFLTNGGKAIPIVICLRPDDLSIIGVWGPRPAFIQQRVIEFKNNPDKSTPDFYEEIHTRYNQNKHRELEAEMKENLQRWSSVHTASLAD
jgi:hypothetical protein